MKKIVALLVLLMGIAVFAGEKEPRSFEANLFRWYINLPENWRWHIVAVPDYEVKVFGAITSGFLWMTGDGSAPATKATSISDYWYSSGNALGLPQCDGAKKFYLFFRDPAKKHAYRSPDFHYVQEGAFEHQVDLNLTFRDGALYLTASSFDVASFMESDEEETEKFTRFFLRDHRCTQVE